MARFKDLLEIRKQELRKVNRNYYRGAKMSEEAKAMIDKARERGYSLNMHSNDKSWYSFSHERYPLNLQLWVNTGDFELVHLKGIIKITTTKCGSFMMDTHFDRIAKEMRKIMFDLL